MYLVAIAVAIAIHNIPEGIATSVPIYYSTGSRKRAFIVSFFSGITEPLGAIIGYLILRPFFNDVVFGILFGIIAGIMVFISIEELLPMAREYEKKQSYYYRRHTRDGNNSAQLTFVSINFTQYINNSYFKKIYTIIV